MRENLGPYAVRVTGCLLVPCFQQQVEAGSSWRHMAHLLLLVLFLQKLQSPALHLLVPDALPCEGVAVVMSREQAEVAVLLRVKVKPW